MNLKLSDMVIQICKKIIILEKSSGKGGHNSRVNARRATRSIRKKAQG